MATRTRAHPGKTAFARDFILRNRAANRRAVEEAWLAAGHEGTISSALVSNLRSSLGLTGKGPGRGGKGGAGRTVVEPGPERKPQSGRRDGALGEIEADLDRLIFNLIALGGMEEIEDGLRGVRRLLYRSDRG